MSMEKKERKLKKNSKSFEEHKQNVFQLRVSFEKTLFILFMF